MSVRRVELAQRAVAGASFLCIHIRYQCRWNVCALLQLARQLAEPAHQRRVAHRIELRKLEIAAPGSLLKQREQVPGQRGPRRRHGRRIAVRYAVEVDLDHRHFVAQLVFAECERLGVHTQQAYAS